MVVEWSDDLAVICLSPLTRDGAVVGLEDLQRPGLSSLPRLPARGCSAEKTEASRGESCEENLHGET